MAKTDTCAFCGTTGTGFKPEHWVSQWISRATIGKNQGVFHHVTGRDPWIGRIVDLTVPHVCPGCNHHWMSDIESRSRDLVLPLIRGAPVTLGKRQQRALATWGFMKLITLELGRPEDESPTYPPAVYRGFCVHKNPPTGCLLSIGYREIPEYPPMFVWWRSRAFTQEVPGFGEAPSYQTTLSVGHLVIEVIGVLHPGVDLHTESDDRLVHIWPIKAEAVDWPPPRRFKGASGTDLL